MKQELLFVEDLSKIKPFWNNLNDFTHTCIDIGQFTRSKRHIRMCLKNIKPEVRLMNEKSDPFTSSTDEFYSKEDFVFYHNSKKVTPLIKEKEFTVNVEIGLNEILYIKTADITDEENEAQEVNMFENITYNIVDKSIKSFYIPNVGDLLHVELENDFSYYLNKISSLIEEKEKNSDVVDFKDEFVFATAKITRISFYCPECNARMFCKQNTPKDISKVLTSATIFDDEDKISLSLTFLEKDVRFKVVWMKSYRKKFVFNKKTLMTYMITGLGEKGNKALLSKTKSQVRIVRIKKHEKLCSSGNIGGPKAKDRYLESIISFLAYRDNYLKELLGKEYEYAHKDIKNMEENFYIEQKQEVASWYANNIKEREKIIKYNTIYNHLIDKKRYGFNNFYMESLIEAVKLIRPSLMKKIRGKSEKEILKFFKLRNKDLKYFVGWNKNYTDCTENSPVKAKINEVYLKVFDLIDDVNYCQRLFKSLIIDDIESRSYISYYKMNMPLRFFKILRSKMSERRFVKFIEKSADENNWYWQDAYRDYSRIGDAKETIDFKKIDNIIQLHDLCSSLYRKMKHENKIIPEEKALKDIFDKNYVFNNEITYSLAKDTHELIDVGAFMNICVGGYDYRAMSKESFILVGYDKEKNPVTCIEINQIKEGSYPQYKVNQVKKKYNQCASHEEQKFLIEEVFNKNNIIATEIFDLRDYYNTLLEIKNDEEDEIITDHPVRRIIDIADYI